jgi:hypothetical protein
VSPVHAPDHPHDWKAFARRWVQSEGLPKELVVLTEGPSLRNPQTNPRLEIIDLRRGGIGKEVSSMPRDKTMETVAQNNNKKEKHN